MKKLFALFLAVFVLCVPCTAAYGANGISFEFEYSGDKIQLNRGFDIYFNANSNTETNISALRLDIYYDNVGLKFLSVESEADVDAYVTENGAVRIVWINSKGQPISSVGERLFTLRFKPLNSTENVSYDFSSNILEVGNSDAEYLSAENSPYINVSKNAAGTQVSSGSSNRSESSSDNSKSKVNSKNKNTSSETSKKSRTSSSENISDEENANNEVEDEAEEESNKDASIGDRKSISSENGFTYFILGAGGTLILTAVVFFSYMFGKKSGKK